MIHIKQVCVQLPAAAVNVTLLAFAPERHGAVRHAVAAPLLPAKWPATNPLHTAAVVARWERQIDGRTQDHYTDPAMHTMRAASIIMLSYDLE